MQSSARSARPPWVVVAVSTVVLVALTLRSPTPTSAQTSRIEVSPASLELLEGESQVVQLSLGEPIISADLEPGFVTVTFSSSAPGLVDLSSSSVTWPAADWHTVREITLTALDDGDDDPTSHQITVTGTVESNSEYYDGFPISFVVTTNDPQPTTTTTEPQKSAPATTTPATSLEAAGVSGSPGAAGAQLSISG